MRSFATLGAIAALTQHAAAAGFRTVGSSGCTVQMIFLQPFTDNAIFLDNYHENRGGPGVNLQTGAHAPEPYVYDGTNTAVFGTEFNWKTNALRKLRPKSNTFCSAGAFFPDGTLVNPSGAEPIAEAGVGDGFDAIRTYAPGPCNGGCNTNWVEDRKLQSRRWYPTTANTVTGDIVVVGGSNVGLLVLNEASINVPTYELVQQSGASKPPVTLPVLQFTAEENNQPNKSYNLYPHLHLLPNPNEALNHIFTIAGNKALIWDYTADRLIKALPDTPLQPRNFPSSATGTLLASTAPNFSPTVLLCGGSSADIPAPQALDDCYTIDPLSTNAAWQPTDRLPNGPQTMSDGILLPDGTVLLINGGHRGSAGGFMADDPVFVPLIYNHSAPAGQRFASQPRTNIPRLYHSVASLLPSGEVLVAGSNPEVFYTTEGGVPGGWPKFGNNGRESFLEQQQRKESKYPTEYRVEIFSPPYMDAGVRPAITEVPGTIEFGKKFDVKARDAAGGKVQVSLVAPGFHTHGVAMAQHMVFLAVEGKDGALSVTAPPNGSVMPPGVYLLFVTVDGIPSEGRWVKLQ